MHQAICFVFLVVLQITLAQEELFKNPDFEDPFGEDDWFCNNACTIEQSTDAYSGQYSGRVFGRYISLLEYYHVSFITWLIVNLPKTKIKPIGMVCHWQFFYRCKHIHLDITYSLIYPTLWYCYRIFRYSIFPKHSYRLEKYNVCFFQYRQAVNNGAAQWVNLEAGKNYMFRAYIKLLNLVPGNLYHEARFIMR